MAKLPAFRSRFEQKVYEAALAAGHKLDYEPYDAQVPYVLAHRYLIDFRLPNGIIVETKGVLKPEDRRKMIAVKRDNPHLDIRFVFMRAANKLRRGAKMDYGQWAEKHGFPWAEGTIPEEWFRERKKKNGR